MTGTSGSQKHLGNLICEEGQKPEDIDNAEGVNVVDLKDRFTTSMYPTPHSDIVALMVLEHQVGMLNRIARAVIETRMALHYQREMNKALDRPADERSDSAWSRIRSVGDAVVQYMLFSDEVRLTDRVEGTSTFASDFAGRGPRDRRAAPSATSTSSTRLFRYPCSYLIYSRAFDSLPDEVKEYVYQTALGRPRRPRDRQGVRAPRDGGSPGHPRDPPRDEAGPAGLLEGAVRRPRAALRASRPAARIDPAPPRPLCC